MLNGENVLDTLPSGLSCCSAVGCEFSVNLSTNTLTKVSLTRSTHKTRKGLSVVSCISRRSYGSVLTQSSWWLYGTELPPKRRISSTLLAAGFPPSSLRLLLSLLWPPPPTPEIVMPFRTQLWPSSLGSATLHANSPAFWSLAPSQSSYHMGLKLLPLES